MTKPSRQTAHHALLPKAKGRTATRTVTEIVEFDERDIYRDDSEGPKQRSHGRALAWVAVGFLIILAFIIYAAASK